MTDAVREYREAGRFTLTSLPNASSDQWFVPASLADAAIEALLDEVARLRCCGNCEHFSSSLYACELWPGHDKDAPESCHFTPSRWKEAER